MVRAWKQVRNWVGGEVVAVVVGEDPAGVVPFVPCFCGPGALASAVSGEGGQDGFGGDDGALAGGGFGGGDLGGPVDLDDLPVDADRAGAEVDVGPA